MSKKDDGQLLMERWSNRVASEKLEISVYRQLHESEIGSKWKQVETRRERVGLIDVNMILDAETRNTIETVSLGSHLRRLKKQERCMEID